MEESRLKYIEIVFDKEKPQNLGSKIKITAKVNGHEGLQYKFIVGKGGIWTAIQEFSKKSSCIWKPDGKGEYIVMVQAKEDKKNKQLDYLAKAEYSIVEGKVMDCMSRKVDEDNSNIQQINISSYEKKQIIREIKDAEEEVAVSKQLVDEDKSEINELKQTSICESIEAKEIDSSSLNEIIDEVIIDKSMMTIGEKCCIVANLKVKKNCLYRFYMKKNKEWDLIRDYDLNNTLNFTANKSGKQEFLVQCKKIDSTESFDDFRVVSIDVKDIDNIQINDIKCINEEIIVGSQLEFKVDISSNNISKDENIVLYKFYKISSDGKVSCLQDYSTENKFSYVEYKKGEYRILCLVKSVLSNRDYDDRAVLVYNVKPYADIKIKSFVANLNSPQATETKIKFDSQVDGGTDILYRYKVRGPIEQDTEFTKKNEFVWDVVEPGEYSIILFVKNSDFNGEYEDSKKIAFTIEKRGKNPIKILDVVVDKNKKTIVGEPVNIMVDAEGGTRLLYSFIIKKNGKSIEKTKFHKSNWIDFTPENIGDYDVDIFIKDKYSDKSYDLKTNATFKSLEYLPGEIDYVMYPYKANHLVGDTIELECVIQNTNNVLVKYETKINGYTVEQTLFSKNKKLRFIPKIAGKYTIVFYAKNIKCEKEYDTKRQINIYVNEASPVINTSIKPSKLYGKVNEEFSIEVGSRGGKDVCYEFYLMQNGEWSKVQSYSKKNFYSFIPFCTGKYKILALSKSYYKKVNYEDYDELCFEVRDSE